MIRNIVPLIGVVLRVGSAAMAHSGGFSSHYKLRIHQLHSLAFFLHQLFSLNITQFFPTSTLDALCLGGHTSVFLIRTSS